MTFTFYILVAAYLLVYLSKAPLAVAMANEGESGYDNRNPRDQQARLSGWGRRALAAHQNSFEVTPLFAVAVITAYLFQADAYWSAVWAAIFLVSRVVYVLFYIWDVNMLRSAIWLLGIISCAALFVLAA